jgi:hypothetical protein
LEGLHEFRVTDDPEETLQLILNSIPWENSTRSECLHVSFLTFARLKESIREEITKSIIQLLQYRVKLRRALRDSAPQGAKIEEPAPLVNATDPDATIKKFMDRQSELRKLIAEGDENIRKAADSIPRDSFEAVIDFNRFEVRGEIKSEAHAKLQPQLDTWRRKRSDLSLRVW